MLCRAVLALYWIQLVMRVDLKIRAMTGLIQCIRWLSIDWGLLYSYGRMGPWIRTIGRKVKIQVTIAIEIPAYVVVTFFCIQMYFWSNYIILVCNRCFIIVLF